MDTTEQLSLYWISWRFSHSRESLWPHGLPRLLCPWNSPGKEYWSHFFLQWIFLTKGSNLGLLHCRQVLYHLSHQGSPRVFNCIILLLEIENNMSKSLRNIVFILNFKILNSIQKLFYLKNISFLNLDTSGSKVK